MTEIPVERVDVLIVGAGPAGLAAATRLKRSGVGAVAVIEREATAGGVPRHCGHPPFGMREFARVLTGPAYARRLTARALAAGVDLRLATTVVAVALGDEIVVTVTSDGGVRRIAAQRLLLATGVRESSRAARLASGDRPLGVLNTGALQAYAYVERRAPFRRPVIVGTKLGAPSSLLTCRAIGATPVAMVEARATPTARRPFMALPRMLGVPVRYDARIVDIVGRQRVERVTLKRADGATEDVACDGVLFTGRFTPEASLARAAGLAIDPGTGGPAIDQFGRTSDPRVFAAGNLLRPVETAGWCWAEGRAVAGFVADDLAGRLPAAEPVAPVTARSDLAYVVPQRLVRGGAGLGRLQLRVRDAAEGRLTVTAGDATTQSRRRRFAPERPILLPIGAVAETGRPVTVAIEQD